MFKAFMFQMRILFIPGYVHWKRVVIFFVAQLMCCIPVILIVYYVIHACNISQEWIRWMECECASIREEEEPSRLLTIFVLFVLYAKASRKIHTVICIVSHTHTCSNLQGTEIFVFLSRKNHTLYNHVDSICVPPIYASV